MKETEYLQHNTQKNFKIAHKTTLCIIKDISTHICMMEGDALNISLGIHRGEGEEKGNGTGAGRLSEKIITN